MCRDQIDDAVFDHLPTDIIFAIDNSASMSEEISALEQNINTSLAQPLAAADIDHQVTATMCSKARRRRSISMRCC